MKKNIFTKFFDYLWNIFLNGLFLILPITLTYALFSFSFKLLKDWLAPIHDFQPTALYAIPHSEIILVILLILILGIISKFFILKALVHQIEHLVTRIPLISPVYKGIKRIVHAFSTQDKLSFQQVVLVEFPRDRVYSLGFLTGEVASAISPDSNKKYFNIFIPTTPNPTSGFFIMANENEFKTTELTRQEAMALIISGGIVQPDRFL
ncbi:MAG: hypothetical protein UR26_C0002G0103 [candidate division TM6 bacterium GW2011_GWF2_32_72]|nr:MAG: hypothetical protein UR26_C0002G0103 [candidate division TM6 bacterium GW2011_GWF2_32_72]